MNYDFVTKNTPSREQFNTGSILNFADRHYIFCAALGHSMLPKA